MNINKWTPDYIAACREASDDVSPCWSYQEAQEALDEIERQQIQIEFLETTVRRLIGTEFPRKNVADAKKRRKIKEIFKIG